MLENFNFGMIRQLRKRRNFTIQQLADRSQLTFPTIVSIETGKTAPSLESLARVANALDMSAAGLLLLCQQKNVLKRQADFIRDTQWAHKIGQEDCRVAVCGDIKVFLIKGDLDSCVNSDWEHGEVFEFSYILSGEVEITVDNRMYTLMRNDTLFFDGTLRHLYQLKTKSELIIFHIPKNPFSLHNAFGMNSDLF